MLSHNRSVRFGYQQLQGLLCSSAFSAWCMIGLIIDNLLSIDVYMVLALRLTRGKGHTKKAQKLHIYEVILFSEFDTSISNGCDLISNTRVRVTYAI